MTELFDRLVLFIQVVAPAAGIVIILLAFDRLFKDIDRQRDDE